MHIDDTVIYPVSGSSHQHPFRFGSNFDGYRGKSLKTQHLHLSKWNVIKSTVEKVWFKNFERVLPSILKSFFLNWVSSLSSVQDLMAYFDCDNNGLAHEPVVNFTLESTPVLRWTWRTWDDSNAFGAPGGRSCLCLPEHSKLSNAT
jgi:hypothetical protein